MYLFILHISLSVILVVYKFVILYCKIKLCSEQKILYLVNAQLLWESLMMPVWLNCNENEKKQTY
jgi:uncharacterized membrane protein YagU involved in acid resistance